MGRATERASVMAIDPGNEVSAYVVIGEGRKPLEFDILDNEGLLSRLESFPGTVVIELVASYGMAVGATTFDTVFWSGRFWEAAREAICRARIYRKDVKMNLCHSMRAKDGNIRQSLIDRYGVVGTKKGPGWFYGFRADIWQAYAVGVTYLDITSEAEN